MWPPERADGDVQHGSIHRGAAIEPVTVLRINSVPLTVIHSVA
jgi:hypothetical protein